MRKQRTPLVSPHDGPTRGGEKDAAGVGLLILLIVGAVLLLFLLGGR